MTFQLSIGLCDFNTKNEKESDFYVPWYTGFYADQVNSATDMATDLPTFKVHSQRISRQISLALQKLTQLSGKVTNFPAAQKLPNFPKRLSGKSHLGFWGNAPLPVRPFIGRYHQDQLFQHIIPWYISFSILQS